MSNVLENQVGGSHYKDLAMQPVELIAKLNLDYFIGNIVKYVTRHRSKNGIEDIKKAAHYVELASYYSKYKNPIAAKFGFKAVAKLVDKYVEANYLTLLERNAIYFACLGDLKKTSETLNKIIKHYDEE